MTDERQHREGSGVAHGLGACLVGILAALGRYTDDAVRVAARYGDDVGRAAMHSSDDIGRLATSGDDLLRHADDFPSSWAAREADAFDVPHIRQTTIETPATGYQHETSRLPVNEIVKQVISNADKWNQEED